MDMHMETPRLAQFSHMHANGVSECECELTSYELSRPRRTVQVQPVSLLVLRRTRLLKPVEGFYATPRHDPPHPTRHGRDIEQLRIVCRTMYHLCVV